MHIYEIANLFLKLEADDLLPNQIQAASGNNYTLHRVHTLNMAFNCVHLAYKSQLLNELNSTESLVVSLCEIIKMFVTFVTYIVTRTTIRSMAAYRTNNAHQTTLISNGNTYTHRGRLNINKKQKKKNIAKQTNHRNVMLKLNFDLKIMRRNE